MKNIHATTVDLDGAGILILGKSGSGKSDLALRLIENKGAVLVSDDRTNIYAEQNQLFAETPKNIEGLLEVRGIGIIRKKFKSKTTIKLVVELCDIKNTERYPFQLQNYVYENVKLDLLKLCAFESSAPDKIVVKLKAVLESKQ